MYTYRLKLHSYWYYACQSHPIFNYYVSHRYSTYTTMIFNHECKLSPLAILLTSFYPTHVTIFGAIH